MNWMPFPAFRRLAMLLLAMAHAAAASAQAPTVPARPPPDPRFTADLVKTGLYVIYGEGGNTLLRFTPSGSILVGGKLPGNYRPLMSQVRRISKFGDLPVRVLVVNDHHEYYTGTNAQFLAAGVPIVAQEKAARRLGTYTLPEGKTAPAIVTYDREYTIKMGGIDVQFFNFGNAHTDGDTVAYFTNLKVVAVGDLYTRGTPDPDFAAGGSLVGWSPVLAEVLKLDFDTAVPGTGPAVSRADVSALKSKLDTLLTRANALVAKGVAKDQLMAQLKTDDLGWQFNFTGEQLDRFYAELSQGK